MTERMRRSLLRAVAFTAALWTGCTVAYAQPPSCRSSARSESEMTAARARDRIPASAVDIPASIRAEHEEIWADLDHASVCPGKVGEAARLVADRLRPHFAREEQIALPPLGLLVQLSRGEVLPEMAAIVRMTDSLAAEMQGMLKEHREIRSAVDRLAEAARSEMRPEQIRLAERLRQHAQTEEEVLYPAAIVVGKYVRLRVLPAGTQ